MILPLLGALAQATLIPPAAAPASRESESDIRLAELNWETCLQDQAQRSALKAVEARAGRPSSEPVLIACRPKEVYIRNLLLRTLRPEAVEKALQSRREQAILRVDELIRTTYSQHNHD